MRVVESLEMVQWTSLQTARDVVFDEERVGLGDLGYIPRIGFLALEETGEADEGEDVAAKDVEPTLYALGFYAPPHASRLPDRVESVTELDKLPHYQRRISRQGKGVGARLYNTPEGAMSAHDEPYSIGAYLFDVGNAHILDARQPNDHITWRKAARIATHAGLVAQTIFRRDGLRKVTDRIHESYGSADLVLMNQPPNPARRQRARGYPDRPNSPSAFMVVRNPDLNIVKVGEVREEFFHRTVLR